MYYEHTYIIVISCPEGYKFNVDFVSEKPLNFSDLISIKQAILVKMGTLSSNIYTDNDILVTSIYKFEEGRNV